MAILLLTNMYISVRCYEDQYIEVTTLSYINITNPTSLIHTNPHNYGC